MKLKRSAAKAALIPNAKTTTLASLTPVDLKKDAASQSYSKPAATSAAVTTIDVKMDVGFGNAIFLRGHGSGLTWDRGVPLVCVDGRTWRWSQTVTDPVTFKVLLNDQVWSAGQDLTVAPGQKLEVAPSFA